MYEQYPRQQRSLLLPVIIGILLAVVGLQLLGQDPLSSLPALSNVIPKSKVIISTPIRDVLPNSGSQIRPAINAEPTEFPIQPVEPVIEQAPVELYATVEQSIRSNPYVANPNREVPYDNNCNGPNPPLVCVNSTNGHRPLVSP